MIRSRIIFVLAVALVSAVATLLPAQAPDVTGERGVAASPILGTPSGPARSGSELDEATESLSKSMRCPKCQGLSVADSPSQAARGLRDEVRALLAQGYSPDQVMDYFVNSYGEFVRLEPTRTGFNLFVWVAPLVGLALGLVAVVLWLRAERSRAETQVEERLDDELSHYRDQVRQETSS